MIFLDSEITQVSKAESKAEQDEIVRFQAFDSSYFRNKSHFEDAGIQNYLQFQPIYKYFNNIVNSNHIPGWKYKGLSDESVKFPAASRNILESYVSTKIQTKLDGSCLKQDKIIFTHKQVVNAYIVYAINLRSFTVAKDFALRNSLFRAYCLLKC